MHRTTRRSASLRTIARLALLAGLALAPGLAAQEHPNHAQGFEPGKLYQFSGLENVNLFNGNLNLTLPVGPSYPVGGDFSYGLTLSYNGNVWEYEETCTEITQECWLGAYPRWSNAGMGWLLSFGFLTDSLSDPHLAPNNSSGFPVYRSPDGADHPFYASLHPGGASTPGVHYTQDGSYLRYREAAREIDFPDGTIRKFETSGRPTEIRDRFGNKLSIAYAPDNSSWTLTDTQGRQHFVYFNPGVYYGKVVDRVVVKAFNGGTATYTFNYTTATIARGCDPTPDTVLPASETVSLLTGITLPDGSAFSMPVSDYNTGTPGTCSSISGHLQGMKLPTGGKMEWSWQSYTFPQDGKSASVYWSGVGLATRTHRNASGASVGQWSYTTSLTSQVPLREMVNTVTDPLGHQSTSYFSVYRDEVGVPAPPGGWSEYEYGLPFTRNQSDGTAPGRYLSTEIRAAGGSLKRKVYVRYESSLLIANHRVASERTVYVDDGSRVADVNSSDFDGLGHYRRVATGGTFDAGNVRESYANFNPGSCASCTPLATAPWVLGTFDYQTVKEGGVRAKTEACFDAATGFLLRTRTLKNLGTDTADPGQHQFDLSTRYSKDLAGNVTAEESFGGDTQSLGTGVLCGLALPAAQYRVDHTYQYGSLKTSQYAGQPFKSADFDRDFNTGLVKTSRDVSGLATSFEYDLTGRLTYTKPAQEGWTQFSYTNASGTTPAKAFINRRTNGGGTILAAEEVHFDPFGRVAVERKKLADGTFSDCKTFYNALGNVTSKTEWGTTASTSYLTYDPFGRPATIRPPDGAAHDVILTYNGVRQVVRKVKVGTGWNGSAVTETQATTTEIYDRQGRLYQVFEPANADGTSSTTTYAYDVGGRLKQVSQTAKNSAGANTTQNRSFTYDNRGLLLSEIHPEKGTSGNGTVSYLSYDARGHAGRILDGPNDLTFTYDGAERVTQIRETGGGFLGCVATWTSGPRCLKTFAYATGNGTGDWRLGKLQTAKRYNYPVIGAATYTAPATETYTYGGKQGRVSKRDTSVSVNGGSPESFTQSWTWNDLGDTASTTYPKCTHAACTAATNRTVSPAYTHGWLTAVPGYASAITYHPNGQVNAVTRLNNVIDTYAKDPNNMARPNKVSAMLGTTIVWNGGVHAYDGAGNMTKAGNAYFLYDGVSRVKNGLLYLGAGAGGATATFNHAYDGFGNLQSLTANGVLRSTPAAATTNRLTGSVTYDAAGNLTYWNGASYSYDRFGSMGRMVNGAEDWLYMYTADDERIWSFKVAGNTSRWTLRDLDGKVLREYQNLAGTWSVQRDYVYRGSQLLAAHTPDAAPKNLVQFHLDHLGTPRAVTNTNGARIAYHVHYPFGEEATSGTQDTERMKFTGHERDLGNLSSAADDLDYMHARFYNPQTGRFLSTDPTLASASRQVPQSWNRYTYVRDNPLRFTDPSGRIVDVVLDVGFILYDFVDIAITIAKDEEVSGTQVGALGADLAAAVVPFATGAGAVVRAAGKVDEAADVARAAAAPHGSRRTQLSNAAFQPVRSQSAVINGRTFTGHALDQMQNRGIPLSVVQNALEHGTAQAGKTKGTTVIFDAANGIKVVVDSKTGRVVTVMYARK
jgi:RHS repeat-associated protein